MSMKSVESTLLESVYQCRDFSRKQISESQRWFADFDLEQLASADSRQQCSLQLRNIAAEAAFLGFAGVVRLCRALCGALKAIEMSGEGPTAEQKLAFKDGLQTLCKLLQAPNSHRLLRTATIVQNVLVCFNLTEANVASPLACQDASSPIASIPSADVEPHPDHRDMNVYRSSRIDSLDQCEEEETWIVSQLAELAEDLASGTHAGHPASRLMHVLRGHKFFSQVDRVCLAGRVSRSNQLVIVDACTSDRCLESPLKKGYSCFVNPQGSLFAMKPGTLRIFAECEKVLCSFSQQRKPAQRSIALIAEQGLRSGLCMALGRGSDIQGFLFLNSRQEDLFQNITLRFAPLISLFGLVATIALDTNGFHLVATDDSRLAQSLPASSMRFEVDGFAGFTRAAVETLQGPGAGANLTVAQRGSQQEFLYLPLTTVGCLAELLVRCRATQSVLPIPIEVQVERDEVRIGFEHCFKMEDSVQWNWLNGNVDSMQQRLQARPVKLWLNEQRAGIAFPLEPLLDNHKHLQYSVVY